jgi:hypothetical protein
VPREQADAVAHGREFADRAVGAAMPGAAHLLLSLALERLVIQTPDGIASDADRLINELAALAANLPMQPLAGAAVTVKG